MFRILPSVAAGIVLWSIALSAQAALRLAPEAAEEIGRRVWRNECGGTVEGLTSWNAGENFASLGIGHFIWYPEGMRGPFEESFPPLLRYLQQQGVGLPAALAGAKACPWSTRAEFLRDAGGARMREIRTFLAATVPQQTSFLVARLESALPKMLAAAPPDRRDPIARQFERVGASAGGVYALIDYVNFKGEGTLKTERYNGEGWGLLQVLEGMSGRGDAVADFAASAKAVLSRRVSNSPPARNEARWLDGWHSRIDTYTR